jgi:feruloyl esterase
MTFGTDSGHVAKDLPEIQAFALNDEALVNFAYAAYKKTRDLALEVAGEFYGNKPERLYYFGGSEGGREGLTWRSAFPALRQHRFDRAGDQLVALRRRQPHRHRPTERRLAQRRQLALVRKAVLAACDADDGLADGIISRYQDCARSSTQRPALPGRQGRGRCVSPTRRWRRSSRCTRLRIPVRSQLG